MSRPIHGLLGYPLGHSRSPQVMKELRPGLDYRLFQIPPASAEAFLQEVRTSPISGFNVTLPYKTAILPLLDALSPTVADSQACNLVTVSHGALLGYNTDILALRSLLSASAGPSLAILGAGGAARAVALVAVEFSLSPIFVLARTPEKVRFPTHLRNHIQVLPLTSAEARHALSRCQTIVHATPLGLPGFASTNSLPVAFRSGQFFLDLTYLDQETSLVRLAKQSGAIARDGWEMLRLQAEHSLRIWDSLS